jgi:hypothetical protein
MSPDIKEVEALLSKANLPTETVHAQAMALDIDTFETFDRLLCAAESRRDPCLREIEHHRAAFGQKLRRAKSKRRPNRTVPRSLMPSSHSHHGRRVRAALVLMMIVRPGERPEGEAPALASLSCDG